MNLSPSQKRTSGPSPHVHKEPPVLLCIPSALSRRSTLDCRRRSTFAYHLDDLRGEAACDSWTPRAASLTGLAGLLKLTHDKHYLKTS
jgi:hypothetical protein